MRLNNFIFKDLEIYYIPTHVYPYEPRMIMFENVDRNSYYYIDDLIEHELKGVKPANEEFNIATFEKKLSPVKIKSVAQSIINKLDREGKWIKIEDNKVRGYDKKNINFNSIPEFHSQVFKEYLPCEEFCLSIKKYADSFKVLREHLTIDLIKNSKNIRELDEKLYKFLDKADKIDDVVLDFGVPNNGGKVDVYFMVKELGHIPLFKTTTLNYSLDNIDEFMKEIEEKYSECSSDEYIAEYKKSFEENCKLGWD